MKPDTVAFEVEAKHPIDDLAPLEQRLLALGARFQGAISQVDTYYNHPCRDFGVTDEALRIRSVGQQNCVTYKGPKAAGPVKTRQEIELPLAPGEELLPAYGQLLEALGFRPVAAVRKLRTPFQLDWQDRTVAGAIDRVEQLGLFVELELMAGPDQLAEAQQSIAALAGALQLPPSERRSYLELLLSQSTS